MKPSSAPFELDSRRIGALPIVNRFLHRLRFDPLLRKHLPVPTRRAKVLPSQSLGILVRSLVLARRPLYSIGEWVAGWVPTLLGISDHQASLVNDDCLGRALDKLFDADRAALLTDLVVHMVKEFGVALDQLHNDSTSLTVSGQYKKATGEPMRGKPTVTITFGHNKDGRPDLKQLLWILTISADGAVPVHFKVADGNVEDSTTHIETWNTLQELVGSSDFLYVADCKLCTRETLRYIAGKHGRFVTIMPRTRKEDRLFKDWLQAHQPDWEEVARKPHPRLEDGPPDIIVAAKSPIPDPDGFRVVWYRSSLKMERDIQFRHDVIHSTTKALLGLEQRLNGPRCRFRSRASVAKVAEDILQKHAAAKWFRFKVTTIGKEVFHKEGPGRPGKNTRWRRSVKTRYALKWELNQKNIDYDARCDGVFPLITNCPSKDLSDTQLLETYKSKQPLIERRHHLLKSVEEAVPLFLKNIGRIEAFLFLAFVALMIQALVERELRSTMAGKKVWAIPLYPEDRPCTAPSAERAFVIFHDVQRHLLTDGNRTVQRFDPDLTVLQARVLGLLEIPESAYARL